MSNKLFSIFSGTHLTVMVCAAILAPSALYGAVTYAKVQITDVNGATPLVISHGLGTTDVFARYRNDPRNYREIYVSNNNNAGCETLYQWVVPTGSAFVITGISGYAGQYGSASSSGFFLYDGAGCSGHQVSSYIVSVSTATKFVPLSVQVGSGIPIAAGSTLSLFSTANVGYTHIHGYLVPASLITAGQVSPLAAAANGPHKNISGAR